MDTVVQKFYGEDSQFTQFGAFTTGFNKKPLQNNKLLQTTPIINPGLHDKTKITPNPQLNPIPNLKPSNSFNLPNYNTAANFKGPVLSFYGKDDILNPRNSNNKNNNTSYYQNIKNKEIEENKKNNTKMQMMEEKMKNLELKSQRLEVINDFFFDMFENNLIKEEINKQREDRAQQEMGMNPNNNYIPQGPYPNFYNNNYNPNMMMPPQKGKHHQKSMSAKHKNNNMYNNNFIPQKNFNLNKYDEQSEFDPKEFQEKTTKNARKVLKQIKLNVGNYLLEDQLKKNEELQTMTEQIVELKNDLTNKLDKLAQKQKTQMETLAFCLQNSGNPKLEELANRVLTSDYYNYQVNNIISNQNYFDDGTRKSISNISIGKLNRSNKIGPRMSLLGSPLNFNSGQNLKKVTPQTNSAPIKEETSSSFSSSSSNSSSSKSDKSEDKKTNKITNKNSNDKKSNKISSKKSILKKSPTNLTGGTNKKNS